jgi:2-oxoglutarate dehydrogenase E1 component
MCAEANIQVAQPTTASQYFHLLRRQMHRQIRKPLIVFTPKSLLRAKPARSAIDELVGGAFQEVLDDPSLGDDSAAAAVRRVILASGKIAFDAMARRDKDGVPVAVVRVEQLYPWPEDQIAAVLARYPNANEVVWLQDEPENMGAWSFAHSRLHRLLRDDFTLTHVARVESGSPASGSRPLHDLEQEDLMVRAFRGLESATA